MKERRKRSDRRKKQRRKLLGEQQFRKLVEKGKVSDYDGRQWEERRKAGRRKKPAGA